MKNNYTLLLFSAAFFCISVQCQKEEGERQPVFAEEYIKLPLITQGGYNTFGCMFNGWAWPAYDIINFYSNIAFDRADKSFQISADTYIDTQVDPFWKTKDYITIYTNAPITNPGEHQILCDNFNENVVLVSFRGVLYSTHFPTNNGTILYLNIHHSDTVNRTLSGTFRISMKDQTGNYTMKVEYGRFDRSYR